MDKNQKNNNLNPSDKDQFAKPAPPKRSLIPQNETLYVNHLNERIKVDLLRENLYFLFSQFGDVLDINVRKSKKMRGQAFIVYKDISEATRAKVSLNNFLFLGSRISVDYAKTKSDIIVKIKGQNNQPNNPNNTEYQQTGTYISRKRKRMIEYGNIKENEEEDKKIESNNEDEDEEKDEESDKEKQKEEENKFKKKKIE